MTTEKENNSIGLAKRKAERLYSNIVHRARKELLSQGMVKEYGRTIDKAWRDLIKGTLTDFKIVTVKKED
jgi:hypothetical protein